MSEKNIKWLYFAAVLMFAAAVFQIAGDHWILGVIFFASGTCFSAAAGTYRGKKTEKQKQAGSQE